MAQDTNRITTSSHELAEQLGMSSAQIRKDLSHFGEFGKQGTGYHIRYLIERLSEILNLTQEWPIALVGAGFLGHALASYRGFETRGFRINWVFDSDPAAIGETIGDLVVQNIDELEETIERHQTRIAILAVPASEAQAMTDRLVRCGIRAILNYAPISLSAPADVHISYSDPVVQLQQMTYYLQGNIEAQA